MEKCKFRESIKSDSSGIIWRSGGEEDSWVSVYDIGNGQAEQIISKRDNFVRIRTRTTLEFVSYYYYLNDLPSEKEIRTFSNYWRNWEKIDWPYLLLWSAIKSNNYKPYLMIYGIIDEFTDVPIIGYYFSQRLQKQILFFTDHFGSRDKGCFVVKDDNINIYKTDKLYLFQWING